jgi:hypothetical protein
LDDSCRSGGVWSWAWSFWVILFLMLLLVVLACIWNKSNVSFKLLSFRYFSNLSCNNYVELRCILNYLWNRCNMRLVMLNHCDLGLYVGWFEIPRNFVGLPELYGLKCENLITPVIIFILVLL